jgi:ATP-dependent helicase/nuclease subunit A
MTRARDRLYICGIKRGNTDADGGWYGLARSALAGACRALPAEPGAEADLEWRADWSLAPHPADPDAARERPEPDLPDWIGRPSPPAVTARRLAPSSAPDAEDAPVPARAAPANETALKRGALAHSLLQALPEIAPAERRDRATTFLALAIPDWPADERDGLRDSILAVLDEPAFAPLFAPGSRAEVGIAGRIADGGIAVSGRIDRVAVTPDRVLIVDYKTNRPAPAGPASVPPGYVRQLALYRALLAGLYPDRTIAAALLWTDIPALMPIPATTLDAALAAATGRLDAGAAGS